MTHSNRINIDWIWLNGIKRSYKVFREEGFKSFWFRFLAEICYRRLLLFEQMLKEPFPKLTTRLPMVIDLLNESEVAEYLAFRTDEYSRNSVLDRFKADHWCFVARYRGKIISASWAAINCVKNSYLGCEIRLLGDEVYVYDSFTRQEYRGKVVSPAIRAEMMQYFYLNGYRKMIIGVVPENYKNLSAIGKLGFKPFAMMGYIKLGTWRQDFYRKY